jgi:hypothetical protein
VNNVPPARMLGVCRIGYFLGQGDYDFRANPLQVASIQVNPTKQAALLGPLRRNWPSIRGDARRHLRTEWSFM